MNEQLDRMELKLAELEGKIDATYEAARKTYRIMFWTGVITLVLFIVPLLAFLLIPSLLGNFFTAEGVGNSQMLQGL